jgi:hypothetical protein
MATNTRPSRLNANQVYDLARNAGFPPETARKMVAIAQRESGFQAGVVGTVNAAKETSYGLWQINWKDPGIKALMIRNGITQPEMLFDPATNARAAALLWDGRDSNLNTAWYIDRVGLSYQQGEKYRDNLSKLPPIADFESSYTGKESPDSQSPSDPGYGEGSGGGEGELDPAYFQDGLDLSQLANFDGSVAGVPTPVVWGVGAVALLFLFTRR